MTPFRATSAANSSYFYEDELYAWIENGRKHSAAPSLAETAAAITAGMKRRPRGGYNF